MKLIQNRTGHVYGAEDWVKADLIALSVVNHLMGPGNSEEANLILAWILLRYLTAAEMSPPSDGVSTPPALAKHQEVVTVARRTLWRKMMRLCQLSLGQREIDNRQLSFIVLNASPSS